MPALETPARIAAACAAAAIALAGALAVPASAAADDPAPPAPLALTVDSTADDADATPGDGTCATAADVCTLRAAIQEVNAGASAAGGAIAFDLPDPTGVNTIAPQTPLPRITERVDLDGFTQPGATMATAVAPAQLRVEVRGTDTGVGPVLPAIHGLELRGGMGVIGPGGTVRSILRTGGYAGTFTAPGPGGVRIDWRMPVAGGASRSARSARTVLVARGKTTFTKAGTVKVRIRLTKAGRRLLRHAGTARPVITVRSRYSGPGVKVDAQRRVTLRLR